VNASTVAPRIEARDLAREVPMRTLLRNLGVRVRSSKRADCPLCKGNSTGTLAFNERLWKCHRCNEGGDVYSLVRAVRKSDFREALKFVAELAGVRLNNHRGPDFRRELAARKAGHERVEAAAAKIESMEREVRLSVCRRIHVTERNQRRVAERLRTFGPEASGAEVEALWKELKSVAAWLQTDLATYTLLSFSHPAERAMFTVKPELRREMVREICGRGYVTTNDGKQFPVLA